MTIKYIIYPILGLLIILNHSILSKGIDMDHFFDVYNKYRGVPENLMLMKHKHVISELEIIKNKNSEIQINKLSYFRQW